MELGWIYSLQAYIELLHFPMGYTEYSNKVSSRMGWIGGWQTVLKSVWQFSGQFGAFKAPSTKCLNSYGLLRHLYAYSLYCQAWLVHPPSWREKKNTHTKVCCLPSFHQILDSRAIAHHYSHHCAVTTTKQIICVAETHPVCIKYQMFGDQERRWWGWGWGLHNLLGNILPNIWW